MSREVDAAGWWTVRVAAVIAVIGLEISTRMLSTTWARLREGLSSVRGGPDGVVSNPQYLAGVALTGLAIGVFLASAWRGRVRAGLATAEPGCPACGEPTKRIRRKTSHKLFSFLLGDDITRRACSSCGWVGLSKDL